MKTTVMVVGGVLLSCMAAPTWALNGGLEYRIALAEDNETYQVFMRPTETPLADISLTGQITLKVPHHSEKGFIAQDLESHIDTVTWMEIARVNAPEEDTMADYVSFSFLPPANGPHAFQWQGNEEKLVFSFKNAGDCYGPVSIITADDPFATIPNSQQTNPGNQFTNLGWGAVDENAFLGIYGEAADCTIATTSE